MIGTAVRAPHKRTASNSFVFQQTSSRLAVIFVHTFYLQTILATTETMEDDFEETGWEGGPMYDTSNLDMGDDRADNPQQVLEECAKKFATPDFIMEPGIFTSLKKYASKNVHHI